MLFSTKAEYGVRLMVELGRRAGSRAPEEAEPVALATVAEAELLPLSYLEHLVAKLRQAGLVSSVRGAHGGYRLARPASEIAMLDVVEALEGPMAPMECFHTRARGAGAVLARERRRPRLRDEAAVDAGPRAASPRRSRVRRLAELVEFAGAAKDAETIPEPVA